LNGEPAAFDINHETQCMKLLTNNLHRFIKIAVVPPIIAIVVLLLSLFSLTVVAQIPEAEVEFYIQSRTTENSLTVGDQLTLRLDVVHPVNSRIALPQVDRDWGSFQVIDQTAPETTDQGNGTAITHKDIIVTIFQPGIYKTPSLVVTHRKPNGDIEDLASPVVQVKYSTVITDSEDLEIRDLKGQAYLAEPIIWPWIVVSILLVTAVILLSIWLIWRFVFKKPEVDVETEPEPEPFIDPRPPEIIAYDELNRIADLKLPEHDQVKEHYSLVSDCIREYIENRYDISALEQTTNEINYAMRKGSLSISHISAFIQLLSESDLVKFAKHKPDQTDIINLIGQARTVVDLTTPEKPIADNDNTEDVSLEKSV